MKTLMITHSHEEGTLIEGTVRGDGSAEVLKAAGWRWSRLLGSWYVRGSRDRMANRELIDRTAAALRASGFEVEVDVDDRWRPTAEVEADKVARWSARAEALTAKASRQSSTATATAERTRELADLVPFGQPILADHYSAPRMRRFYEKIEQGSRKAYEQAAEADQTAARARAAEAHVRHHESPYTVANRIDRLTRELRKAERAGSTRAEHLRDELTYWQEVRAGQLARGEAIEYGPETVTAGDMVNIGSSGWWVVHRANPTTVTLRSQGCQTRTPYHQVRDHRHRTEQR